MTGLPIDQVEGGTVDPIHDFGGQLKIERVDPDVARRKDPYALRGKRRPPHAVSSESGEGQAEPEAREAGSETSEPRVVGSRLDVRA